MGPLLGKFPPLIDETVEKCCLIGSQAGKKDLVMGWNQDVNIIQLHQPQLADDPAQMLEGNLTLWPWTVKPLGRQGDLPGFD
jgi:hypothetical protein